MCIPIQFLFVFAFGQKQKKKAENSSHSEDLDLAKNQRKKSLRYSLANNAAEIILRIETPRVAGDGLSILGKKSFYIRNCLNGCRIRR